jgi:basic amino acid/polyamine antiporter, APA family
MCEDFIRGNIIGTLFAFILVCFDIIILRIKEPGRHRTFKIPLNPVIPLLGVASYVFLMTALPGTTWIRFIVWLALGLIVYFSYSINHRTTLSASPLFAP